MAIDEHINLLLNGATTWNKWRLEHPDVVPDLSKAFLMGKDFSGTNLANTNLAWADLLHSVFSEADLSGADLTGADARWANFAGATLTGANLSHANFNEANLVDADITGCRVYGITVWNVKLGGVTQSNLIITQHDEPTITTDDVEMAQFVYLLLTNSNIRNAIDTVASKIVLILGRFTPDRKNVLDRLKSALREHNCVSVLFDFEKPISRNLTETVSSLAHLSRFVIADLSEAKSIPQELQAIVPHLPSLPIQPIVDTAFKEYSMFQDFLDYPWVLTPYHYAGPDDLISNLNNKVIVPALQKADEIKRRRAALEQNIKSQAP